MSIPTYIPKFRSSKIKYNLVPINRKNKLHRQNILNYILKVQNVLLFWIMLAVFARLGLIFFLTFANEKRFSGLYVSLPSACNSTYLTSNDDTIYIWIDRMSHIVINDFLVKKLNDIDQMLIERKKNDRNQIVRLYIDKQCSMDNPIEVISKLKKYNFQKIHFVTERSVFK